MERRLKQVCCCPPSVGSLSSNAMYKTPGNSELRNIQIPCTQDNLQLREKISQTGKMALNSHPTQNSKSETPASF